MWYIPEHSLASYYYAFFEKADFIDVDIHPTKDGTFIVYHDPIMTPDDVEGLRDFPQIFHHERKNHEFLNLMNLRRWN